MSNNEDSDWANLSYGSDSLEEDTKITKPKFERKKASPQKSINIFNIFLLRKINK
jgi:hypothetical protein